MERDDIIDFLRKYELIRSSNCINISFGTKLRTLWIPKKSPWLRLFAFLSNVLLMVSWLPLLVVGITLFSKNIVQMDFDYLWTGYFIGLFCGLFFHELGHAFAGISYGARVFEMGVMVMYCILPGAYVLLDRSTVKRRMQRVQVNVAGIGLAVFSWYFAAGTQINAFYAASVIWLATGIIVWKLDKIQRLLEEKNSEEKND